MERACCGLARGSAPVPRPLSEGDLRRDWMHFATQPLTQKSGHSRSPPSGTGRPLTADPRTASGRESILIRRRTSRTGVRFAAAGMQPWRQQVVPTDVGSAANERILVVRSEPARTEGWDVDAWLPSHSRQSGTGCTKTPERGSRQVSLPKWQWVQSPWRTSGRPPIHA